MMVERETMGNLVSEWVKGTSTPWILREFGDPSNAEKPNNINTHAFQVTDIIGEK